MKSLFDNESWDKYLRGYTIADCAMNNKNRYTFLLVEEQENRDIKPRTRFVIVIEDDQDQVKFGHFETSSLSTASIARGVNPAEYVAVDSGSRVYSSNSSRKGREKPMDRVIDMRTPSGTLGTIRKVVRVAGQVYAVGNYRKIYRRIGMDRWIEFGAEGKGIPLPADVETHDSSMSLGFNDLDGFDENDMYAVGGYGDLWRFDGRKWHSCAIPTDAILSTVCCAGDGLVYITELNGSVWAGRADHWTMVASADLSPGSHPVDAVWFNDRLYLGAQQGLWTIDAARKSLVPLQKVESDAPNPTNGGRLDLSADGGYLLTAGPYGACLHNGTGWRRLFSILDFL